MVAQVLDSMDIERERGITIKAQTATLRYKSEQGGEYELNLIDTPGHADFAYEVSRSLGACEGALVLVDATQGIQAQTVANCYKAVAQGLDIIPVINKIDLPGADIERTTSQIEQIIGLSVENLLCCSAKTGAGTREILEAVVHNFNSPQGDPQAPLQALVIDSWFDAYAGVVVLVRVMAGELRQKAKVRFMEDGIERYANEIGQFTPRATPCDTLTCGQLGYLIGAIKDLSVAKVGDTITTASHSATKALPGFQQVSPQLFASFFPIEADLFVQLKEAFERLRLNDSALTLEYENSVAFGQGVRCGFLGMLHLEIIQERLLREHQVESIITAPSVAHEIELTDGSIVIVKSAAELPSPTRIRRICEPMAEVTILQPEQYVGSVIQLCNAHRGRQLAMEQSGLQAISRWRLPMAELVMGFVGELKSATHGYASFDYEASGFEVADIVRVDILVNGDGVDALSMLVPRGMAERRGRELLIKLKDAIPRQQFKVPLQAVIGGKIIAREDIRALRKNVLAKCYGGDVTRKKKLIERQKRGKKRMRKFGNVDIPQEAFLAVLDMSSGNG